MSFFLVSFFLITNYMQVIDLWLFLLLHHFTDVTFGKAPFAVFLIILYALCFSIIINQ